MPAGGSSAMEKRRLSKWPPASGLVLVPTDRLDPRVATSYGTGQLIKTALDQGITQVYHRNRAVVRQMTAELA